MNITHAELLDALAQAMPGAAPDAARTVVELCGDLGWSVRRVREALKALHAQGRLVAHQAKRADLSGRMQWVPAYTILPAKKARR